MKVRIKSFNGELPEYLTDGKVYEVTNYDSNLDSGYVVDDLGSKIITILNKTAHLNGGSWEVIDE